MARRDLNVDEESRSYAGVWLIGAVLLVVGAVWALIDDVVIRRPWKAWQSEFYTEQQNRELARLEAEDTRLEEDEGFQKLLEREGEEQAKLEDGESGSKLAAAQARLAAAKIREADADLAVRFVKSELEEAWYQYDHALETGHNVDGPRAARDELIEGRAAREAEWEETKAAVAAIEAEIAELQAPLQTVKDQIDEATRDRQTIENRIVSMKSELAGFKVDRIPSIEQTVLPNFDLNNFEQPVARVDRCTTCHIGINRAGFEDLPQPLTTHPERELYLGRHPTNKYGCTSCHDGQGVAVNSPEQAHGDVPFWLHPLLREEQMQSRCLDCHRDISEIKGAEDVRQGEQLFEQLGCHGCHLVSGYEELEAVGPSLRRISAKVDPGWMVDWIKDPQAFRPRTKMPHFVFDDEQAKAAAAYLWSSSEGEGKEWLASHPEPTGVNADDAALVAKGKELFDSVGCRACHAIEEGEIATPLGVGKDWAPNLNRVGEKTSSRFIYWWILDPRGYNPETRMPDLRLTEEEAAAITSYLVNMAPAPERALAAGDLESPELVAEGEKLVRKYGCYACHNITGMEKESRIGVELSTFASKPLEELFFGNNPDMPRTWNAWTHGKLENPRMYETEHVEQLMPNFRLEEKDIIDIRAWLQSRKAGQPPLEYRGAGYLDSDKDIQEGRRLVEKYNCRGCHEIDGQGGHVRRLYEDNPSGAPPILYGQGEKVQPDWFFGFLQDPARQPLRFWLDIRMPTFHMSPEETAKVVKYFSAKADQDAAHYYWDPARESTPDLLHTGELLMSEDYFSCWSCHVRGEETPQGPMEQWAPNLAFAAKRLKPAWVLEWIADPQSLMPGTKMPAFFEIPGPGEAPVGGPDDIFDGDASKQIMAMRDYIMALGWEGGATMAKTEEEAPVEAEEVPAAEEAPADDDVAATDGAGAATQAAVGSDDRRAEVSSAPGA